MAPTDTTWLVKPDATSGARSNTKFGTKSGTRSATRSGIKSGAKSGTSLYQVAPCRIHPTAAGTSWYQLVPAGTSLYQLVPSGTSSYQWCRFVPAGTSNWHLTCSRTYALSYVSTNVRQSAVEERHRNPGLDSSCLASRRVAKTARAW